MIKNIKINLSIVNQRRDTRFLNGRLNEGWAYRTCAICSLKMVLSWHNEKYQKIPITKLVNQGLKLDGYIEGVGWRHQTVVDLARLYGLNLKRKFCKTKISKLRGLGIINKKIEKGLPVMLSIFYKLNKNNGGHIVVVNGIKKSSCRVIGYHIQDPDHRFRGNNYYITKSQLIDNWRGGVIYI